MSEKPEFVRPKLTALNGETKVLLHSCCALCSGEVMEAIPDVLYRLSNLLAGNYQCRP